MGEIACFRMRFAVFDEFEEFATYELTWRNSKYHFHTQKSSLLPTVTSPRWSWHTPKPQWPVRLQGHGTLLNPNGSLR
jgi:hypothetical protein